MNRLGAYVLEIQAPHTIRPFEDNSFKIFMAGGISDCWDWQRYLFDRVNSHYSLKSDVEMKIKHPIVTIYNPRRDKFDVHNKEVFDEQITWEYNKLKDSDLVVFWFTDETIQPITLLELGKELGRGKRVLIGRHDDYERADDIELQAKLAGYNDKFYWTLEDLADAVVKEIIGRRRIIRKLPT